MPAKAPSEVVHEWFERVWNRGEESAIDELFVADGIAHGLPANADGSPIRGPEAFKPFARGLRSAIPDIRITITKCITEGDTCAVFCEVSGTHSGDGLGISATGRKIFFTGMTMARIENGLIQEGWNSYDFLSLNQQIGLIPQTLGRN